MMEIILYILLTVLVIIVGALLLPARIYIQGTGSTDTGFEGAGRIMFFSGLLGGGGEYRGEEFRAGFYAGSKRVYAFDAARLSRRARKKKDKAGADERKEREKEKSGEPSKKGKTERIKAPFVEKIRLSIRKGLAYSSFGKTVLHEIQSLFRVDRFDTGIILGFGDPARTGQAMGILYALNGILPERFVIRTGGDFTRRVFSGSIDIKVTFRTWLFWMSLVRVLWLFMRLRRQTKTVYRESFEAQEA